MSNNISMDGVIDVSKGYHPRIMEMALRHKKKVCLNGKKPIIPRLKHRPNGIKCISKDKSAWTGGEIGKGYVTSPIFCNPQKGESFLSLSFSILMEQFDPQVLGEIRGRFNKEPIRKYNGIEKLYSLKCCFECQNRQSEDCHCVWRPYQRLDWGYLDSNNNFSPITEIIRANPISMFELRDKVKERVSNERWLQFRNKYSKRYEKYSNLNKDDITALKLIDHWRLMQRRSFSSINCYGAELLQFGLAVETFYKTDDFVIFINLAVVNDFEPFVESQREARARLKKSEHGLKLAKQDEEDAVMEEDAAVGEEVIVLEKNSTAVEEEDVEEYYQYEEEIN